VNAEAASLDVEYALGRTPITLKKQKKRPGEKEGPEKGRPIL